MSETVKYWVGCLTGVAHAVLTCFSVTKKTTAAFAGASLMQLLLASYALTELTSLTYLQVKWFWCSWLVNSKPAGELRALPGAVLCALLSIRSETGNLTSNPHHVAAGSSTAPAAAQLPPEVFGLISRLIPPSSRASLSATCTAARDGVLGSCQSLQITLVNGMGGLQQCASLLCQARQRGCVKEDTLTSISLRLQVVHNVV
jgi:hypothetical protein